MDGAIDGDAQISCRPRTFVKIGRQQSGELWVVRPSLAAGHGSPRVQPNLTRGFDGRSIEQCRSGAARRDWPSARLAPALAERRGTHGFSRHIESPTPHSWLHSELPPCRPIPADGSRSALRPAGRARRAHLTCRAEPSTAPAVRSAAPVGCGRRYRRRPARRRVRTSTRPRAECCRYDAASRVCRQGRA